MLVAEQDPSTRARYADVLQDAGLPVLEAASGEEALDLIRQYPVAAVVVGGRLAGMDALGMLRLLRAGSAGRTLPVLLVGGSGRIAERVAGLEAGADDYLAHPVHLDELAARVNARLRGDATWRARIDEHARDRAAMIDLLRSVRVEAAPEFTAAGLCRELTRLRGLAGAAVVVFTSAGEAVPLAVSGNLPRRSWPLPAGLAAMLRAAAQAGPWVADRIPREIALDRPSAPPASLLADPASPFAAYAPLTSRGDVLGVLVIAPRSGTDSSGDARARLLGVAVEAAAASSALLAASLGEWGVACSARAELEWVLGGGAFSTVFQPIHDVDDGRIVGFEALTRFADGSPAEPRFLEAAQVGMGLEIEAATLAAAISAADSLPGGAWLSVNVSPTFLLQRDYMLRIARSSPRPLVLELTEHEPIEDYAAIRAALDELGSSVRVSIDDAGSGYACLNHVLSLGPAFVKLDPCWVRGIDADPARQALVAGLQHFTSRTGTTLIAEGVETPDELQVLRRLRVPLAQGFLLGRPMAVR